MDAINLLGGPCRHFGARAFGELNGVQVKVARIHGEFVARS